MPAKKTALDESDPPRRTVMADAELGFALQETSERIFLRDTRTDEDVGIFEHWQRLDAIESYERARQEVRRDRAIDPSIR